MDQKFIIKYNEASAIKRHKSTEGFVEWSKNKNNRDKTIKNPVFKMDMTDLNDYLQEILDKYKIPGDYKHGNDFHYVIGTSTKYGIKKPTFFIFNIPESIFLNLYNDLIMAWDNIEKRLSHKIMIDYEDSRTWVDNNLVKSYQIDGVIDCIKEIYSI